MVTRRIFLRSAVFDDVSYINGNNGKDASGDIAVTWSTRGGPVLICAYTQGGAPTPRQVEAVFAGIGSLYECISLQQSEVRQTSL